MLCMAADEDPGGQKVPIPPLLHSSPPMIVKRLHDTVYFMCDPMWAWPLQGVASAGCGLCRVWPVACSISDLFTQSILYTSLTIIAQALAGLNQLWNNLVTGTVTRSVSSHLDYLTSPPPPHLCSCEGGSIPWLFAVDRRDGGV